MDDQVGKALLAQIEELESKLANRAESHDGRGLSEYLAEDFCEIGFSGTVYNKADAQSVFEAHAIIPHVAVSDFEVCSVAEGVVLAKYISSRPQEGDTRLARRSSLWRYNGEGFWQIVFHQATPL